MTACLGAGSQKADFDITFGTVQLVRSMRMTATVAFGGVGSVNISGNLPFPTICDAVKNVNMRMAVCHLCNFRGFGLSVRGMLMIMLGFSSTFVCSCMCTLSLSLGLESKTHVISLVRVDAVPCAH